MKRLLIVLPLFFLMTVTAQNNNLSTVNMSKPKNTQRTAFEAAYKKHIAQFHKGNLANQTYEILSGPNTGFYFFVNGGRSMADFDNERPDDLAHRQDLEKNFFPYMEETRGTQTYRYLDSLGVHTDVQAEKYAVSVRYLKDNVNLGDYRRELGRSARVLAKLKSPFFEHLSFGVWEQLWDGSTPVFVTIRSLKDGFKELEQGYFGPAPAGFVGFRDQYIKDYGYDAWDERVKLLDNAVEKLEQYIMKHRPDLSSQ